MKIKAIFLPTFLLFLLIIPPAFAITISLDPADQEIMLGGTAIVDIKISELVATEAPSLGAFDLTLTYDPTILSFNSVEFGLFLGDATPGASVTNTDDSIAGELWLFEVSLLSIAELDAIQPENFTLATLKFSGIGPGISAIGFDRVDLSDATGLFTLDPDFIKDASISVAEPVPEPTTILLVSTGLLGLAGLRRRSRK